MKRKFLLVAGVIIAVILLNDSRVFAQNEPQAEGNEKPGIYWLYDNMYRSATKYSDYQAATNALYSLIAIEPQNDSLRFNLAYLYYEAQRYPSAVLAARDVLQLNPNHTGALEVSAYCYETLGIPDQALSHFEKLYIITENVETLYKMAFLQFDLKRFAESQTNVDILLDKPEVDQIEMTFNVSEEETQEFTLRVAVLNLKGLVLQEMGDVAGAKKAYNDALAIAPNFTFAKQNLDKLN